MFEKFKIRVGFEQSIGVELVKKFVSLIHIWNEVRVSFSYIKGIFT